MPWKLSPRRPRPIPEPVERFTIVVQPSEDDRARTLVALGYGDLVGLLAALAEAGRPGEALDADGTIIGRAYLSADGWRFWADRRGERRPGVDWELRVGAALGECMN